MGKDMGFVSGIDWHELSILLVKLFSDAITVCVAAGCNVAVVCVTAILAYHFAKRKIELEQDHQRERWEQDFEFKKRSVEQDHKHKTKELELKERELILKDREFEFNRSSAS